MNLLKLALTTPPALVSLDYTEGAGDIILAVDACKRLTHGTTDDTTH